MWKLFASRQGSVEKRRPYDYLVDLLFCLLGTMIYALSVTVFTAPNKIAPGGITGIATVLHYLFGTPIGTMYFILNIPLLLLGLRYIGGEFIIKTMLCTAGSSLFIDLFGILNLPVYRHNLLLAALYGGVLSGAGLGFVFLRGATTGGTDVASRLIKLKYRHVSMGRMMFILDACVIILAAVAFRSVDSALYAMITIFVTSRIVDAILYGSDFGKTVLVISKKNDEIAHSVVTSLNRGVTILKGRGYYTGADREVLLCAVRRPEVTALRAIVQQVDPQAFVIVCDASEVIGEGFKPITKEL